ncbi:MAG TPA: DUF5683 domain-containing protein [Longimicrobiales bacterium]
MKRLGHALTATLTLLLLGTAGATAQERDSVPSFPTEIGSLEGRPSPVGAMLRSFVVPGWGQLSYDRYVRSAVYFGGHVGNTYMVIETLGRLDAAEESRDRRISVVRDSLVAAEVPTDSIDVRIGEDAEVRRLRGLVSARKEQREDWIALGVFWILVSGVDAFVTAQLADFPASIGAVYDGRRYGIYVSVPVR